MHVSWLLCVLIFCTFSSAQCHGGDRLMHGAQGFARSVKPQFFAALKAQFQQSADEVFRG